MGDDVPAFGHARVATARVRPGSAAAVRAAWASLLQAYADTGVFGGMLSLHDAAEDLAVTVTLWSTAEAVQGPPDIAPYDVLLLRLTADDPGGLPTTAGPAGT